MTPPIAFLAALAGAVCHGVSTVQQKVGADFEEDIHSFDLTFLWRLLKNRPYILGIFLSFIGYGFVLVALRVLPLFLVQAIGASSIVVTAYGERLFLHKKLGKQSYFALAAVIAGLIIVSIGAVSGRAAVGSFGAKLLIELLPVPLAAVGLVCIYMRKPASAVLLAALGGLAYGNTATIGRIIIYPHPYWKLIENPLLLSLVASAVLGQYLFSVSLQRVSATKSNAIMIVLETLGPAVCGLLFFDDKIRNGFQLFVLLGSLLVLVGSVATAAREAEPSAIKPRP